MLIAITFVQLFSFVWGRHNFVQQACTTQGPRKLSQLQKMLQKLELE